jgi:hypothetical protein
MNASSPMSLDLPSMEAEAVDEIPSGPGWQYEPKYDGFPLRAACRMKSTRDGSNLVGKGTPVTGSKTIHRDGGYSTGSRPLPDWLESRHR